MLEISSAQASTSLSASYTSAGGDGVAWIDCVAHSTSCEDYYNTRDVVRLFPRAQCSLKHRCSRALRYCLPLSMAASTLSVSLSDSCWRRCYFTCARTGCRTFTTIASASRSVDCQLMPQNVCDFRRVYIIPQPV